MPQNAQEKEDKLKELRSKRGFVKANLTRVRTYLSKLNLDIISKKCFLELQRRLSNLSPLLHEFDAIQTEIELFCPDTPDIEEVERDNFERDYYELCSTIEEIIDNHSQSPEFNLSHTEPAFVSTTQFQLPILNLEIFNGDYNKWVEFRDCFEALVGKNNSLSSVQKMCYLRKALSSEPLKTIESLSISETNYEVAWKALKTRYEKGKRIIESHVRKIIGFPALQRESFKELRNLYDTVNNNLQALKTLNQPVDSWDTILIPIISDKLDFNTKREWELLYIKDVEQNPNDDTSLTVETLLKSIKRRCDLLESLHSDTSRPVNKITRSDYKGKASFSGNASASALSCYFCKKNHTIYRCDEFLKLNVHDRIKEIKKRNYCINCLRPHELSKCLLPNCRNCNKFHNTLLHIEKSTSSTNATIDESLTDSDAIIKTLNNEIDTRNEMVKASTSCSTATTLTAISSSQIVLPTAMVYVHDNFEKVHEFRALLDSGSMANFVTKRLLHSLNLATTNINHSIVGVGQVSSKIRQKSVLTISSKDKGFQSNITCLVLENITSNIPLFSFDSRKIKIPCNINLADRNFNVSRPIDILLGSGLFWQLINGDQIKLNAGHLVLQSTKLGYIIAGSTPNPSQNRSVSCLNLVDLDTQVRKFWETEEIHAKPGPSLSDKYCETHFVDTHTRDNDGRFVVKVPLKKNYKELGNSKEGALKRFLSLEGKLSNNKSLRSEYVKFMNEYKQMNHMSEISEFESDDELNYYIPHHAVIRDSSSTTKVRVVFDASMKTSSGLSLNDVQYVGPTIQRDLFSVILNFRVHQFVLTADISKMYRMIKLKDEDKCFHRIFWRDHPSRDLKCYHLNTVTYGTSSAPFLAIRCLYQLAKEHEREFPIACEAIKNNFYVDDFLYGSDSASEIVQVQRDVTNILQGAGMYLRKWLCNKPEIISKFKLIDNMSVNTLKLGEKEANKTLGILWNATSDTIEYSGSIIGPQNGKMTKRTLLSEASRIFDPMGLLSPITVVTKLLLQELWQLKVGWDECVPSGIELQWQQFKKDLIFIKNVKIQRKISSHDKTNIQLHGFGDASERAYGACVYVRTQLRDGTYFSRLLCAKSRVSPLKKLSLPRLELSAALLLAQLIDKIKECLSIKFERIYLWSDSTITLSWIRADPHKWKTFVANRVAEIQRLTNINDWNHVISSENPADLVSRGTTPHDLIENILWWSGPNWLSQSELPKPVMSLDDKDSPEQRSIAKVVTESEADLFERFSNLNTLKRVIAYCFRFISNARLKFKDIRNFNSLSVTELEHSLVVLINIAQESTYHKEYCNLVKNKPISKTSHLSSLNPFIDSENLIRVGGRLNNSAYSIKKRNPIILPSNHLLTKLILRHEHIRLLHCGSSALLASIRERYWPIHGRRLAKGIVRSCIQCFKNRPRTTEYLMGELPAVRVNPSPPFHNVGIDYAGPFSIKDGITKKARLVNCYVCLFVCLSTKAIHLEVVSNLTTKCFLASLKRFASRRGKPLNIYSDNARNFLGASRELKSVYEFLNANSNFLYDQLANEQITWHFIPARSPTFGGIWEANIKSVKVHLKRVYGNALLTYEEFLTILVQIEAVVNSRPLCPLTTDPDIIPLTPSHFLIGRRLTGLPEDDYTTTPDNRLKRYALLQKLVQHFWKRWHKEYMSELQTRTKWRHQKETDTIQIGKVVLVKEDNAPPLQWPMGIIVDVHPGADNITRVVSVKVRGKVISRSVLKICVLPDNVY